MDRELSRRTFVAGIAGALALVFAPIDRFLDGIGRVFDSIFGRTPDWRYETIGPTGWADFARHLEVLYALMYEAVGSPTFA